MSQSWLNLAGGRFARAVKGIVAEASTSVLSDQLGEEDTQCQHLFTRIFSRLQAQQERLSDYLVTDSRIRDLVMVLRYYRSRRRRRGGLEDLIQFVESETGADFALSLKIDLADIAEMNRHTLGQAKLIEADRIRIDRDQLQKIDEAAGGELGVYAIWGEGFKPAVLTISNLKAVVRASSTKTIPLESVARFTRPLEDYMVDEFLGLWHGADFYADEIEEEQRPRTSPPTLFHLLHMGAPPPNIFHMDVTNARLTGDIGFEGAPPGFYIVGIDSKTGEPFDE